MQRVRFPSLWPPGHFRQLRSDGISERLAPYAANLHGHVDLAQSDQIVGDDMQTERCTDIALSPLLELAHSTELIDPAKDILDPSAYMDGFGVPLGVGGPSVNRGATGTTGVLDTCGVMLIRRITPKNHGVS